MARKKTKKQILEQEIKRLENIKLSKSILGIGLTIFGFLTLPTVILSFVFFILSGITFSSANKMQSRIIDLKLKV